MVDLTRDANGQVLAVCSISCWAAQARTEFLRSLRDRRLSGLQLVISESSSGLLA
jgi:hypothetical protein